MAVVVFSVCTGLLPLPLLKHKMYGRGTFPSSEMLMGFLRVPDSELSRRVESPIPFLLWVDFPHYPEKQSSTWHPFLLQRCGFLKEDVSLHRFGLGEPPSIRLGKKPNQATRASRRILGCVSGSPRPMFRPRQFSASRAPPGRCCRSRQSSLIAHLGAPCFLG